MDFGKFADAIKTRYEKLASLPTSLLVVDVPKDTLWLTYLYSFENDPIFKTRNEHDCSCCRHFIYDVGRVVALVDGKKQTLWDVVIDDEPQYQKTADTMAELIWSAPITSVFTTLTETSGAKQSRALIDDQLYNFSHFHAKHKREYVFRKDTLATERSALNTQAELLERSLTQISPDALTEVLELIASNALYRGSEHQALVVSFQKLQREQLESGLDASTFAWMHFRKAGPAVCSIKNSVIGTLLVDLASGSALEEAVKRFEVKVAPTNYKRPTALVTPRMIEEARAKLIELGLYDSIARRYANLSDVSINDVLYADRGVQPQLKDGDLFDLLKSKATTVSPKTFDRVDTIGLEAFLAEVLPLASTVEVFLENKHEKNLVSVVTAANPDAAPLFKWSNPFSWSYNGDLADSYIKERVAAKGGNVTGDVCCRLAWNNYDDLDFHMTESTGRGGSYKIFYQNRRSLSPSRGRLDVDAMASGGRAPMPRDPVENIFYGSVGTMRDGEYLLQVHQYRLMEKVDTGFTVEIDLLGEVHRFQSATNPPQGQLVDIARLKVRAGKISITPLMQSTAQSRKLWGLETQNWQRVAALLKSPNHWEGEAGIGNLHYFFLLDGCINDGNARGFYNEFLRDELNPHRKVLELVGSKSRTAETVNQLSGVGFSNNGRQQVIVRVTGRTQRVLKVSI
ncbi:hypothetical protein [Armatimonas rosea]|uniref:Uncharacterized protein n=1 Tax=Armatimonas rosea TaxID=685828 RepID=A0A7W9SVD1_ARMRO|nr:hypothetical protein [Armatimonas rosea]MBB6053540.1 hypothetical protein [Armatimonas rosea]